MERLYSDDQEAMFVEAQVFEKPGEKVENQILLPGDFSIQEKAGTSEEEDDKAYRGV